MKNRFTLLCMIIGMLSAGVIAQIRPAEPVEPAKKGIVVDENERQMLDSIYAKYQGGLFGYSKKEHGTITFDEINERLKFTGEDGKERFSIPYYSLAVVYASQTKVQSGTGRVIGAIPLPGAGLGGLLMKKQKNYVVITFDDPDVDAKGTINFLVDTPQLLFDSIYTIGEKAEMKQRGDAYIRRRDF